MSTQSHRDLKNRGMMNLAQLNFFQKSTSVLCLLSLPQHMAPGAGQCTAQWNHYTKHWTKVLLIYSSPTFSSVTAGISFTCDTELYNLYTLLRLKIPKLHRTSKETMKDMVHRQDLQPALISAAVKKCLVKQRSKFHIIYLTFKHHILGFVVMGTTENTMRNRWVIIVVVLTFTVI